MFLFFFSSPHTSGSAEAINRAVSKKKKRFFFFRYFPFRPPREVHKKLNINFLKKKKTLFFFSVVCVRVTTQDPVFFFFLPTHTLVT